MKLDYFLKFFILNAFLLTILEVLILLNNTKTSPFPWRMFFIMLTLTFFLVALQYPILLYKTSWLYKTLIFFLTMLLFLFCYGFIENLLSNSQEKSLLDNALMGVMTTIFGGMMAGIWVTPVVVLVNWLFRNNLFSTK